MGQISLSIPQVGLSDQTEDPKVANDLTIIQTWANGNIDATNLSAVAAQSAGVNQVAQTVKGIAPVGANQSTSSTTYTTMATPDQVSGIVLSTNGLIAVWYQALWQESVVGAGRAAIFLGANQLQVQGKVGSSVGPQVTAAATGGGGSANVFVPLVSHSLGLASSSGTAGYGADATTGQAIGYGGPNDAFYELSNSGIYIGTGILGGPCYIRASAGTYTVSVQFKASSGSVTVDDRTLWVQAISFA